MQNEKRYEVLNYNHLQVKRKADGIEWNKNSPKELLQYALGALLYAPGNHIGIRQDIVSRRYPALKNIVLCLEDSILDHHVEAAEAVLIDTIKELYQAQQKGKLTENEIPLIFIRVRNSGQMLNLTERMGQSITIITGFIAPKLDKSNGQAYRDALLKINEEVDSKIYLMPVLESPSLMSRFTRQEELFAIRETVDSIKDYILNIRVGGNDFSNLYGLRRSRYDTIYDVSVVRDILIDIINVFAQDYVVSAPVWEYFGEEGDKGWQQGLINECRLDRLNGFIGKTAIHPSQLRTIQEAYMVEEEDYLDALSILNWKSDTLGVEKGKVSMRMNEVKIHGNWAKKIMALARIYGVKVQKYDHIRKQNKL